MTVIGLSEEKEAVVQAVLSVYGLSRKELKSRTRTNNISQARFVAWHHMYKDLGMSLMEVGREFNRHHSDVIYGLKRIEKLKGDSRIVSARAKKVREILKHKDIIT